MSWHDIYLESEIILKGSDASCVTLRPKAILGSFDSVTAVHFQVILFVPNAITVDATTAFYGDLSSIFDDVESMLNGTADRMSMDFVRFKLEISKLQEWTVSGMLSLPDQSVKSEGQVQVNFEFPTTMDPPCLQQFLNSVRDVVLDLRRYCQREGESKGDAFA